VTGDRSTRRLQFAISVTIVVAALIGCQVHPRRTSGLDGIEEAGVLRVIVRPGFLSAPVHRLGSFNEAELLRRLADRLEVDLQWIEPARHSQILPWLREGRGDLAISRFSQSALPSDISASVAVDWVEDLMVAGRGSSASRLGHLARDRLYLHRSASSWLLGAAGISLPIKGMTIVEVPEEVPLEEILERVRAGRYGVTVADSALVEAARFTGGLRLIGPPLSERRPLVWATRKSNRRLLMAVNDFLFAEQVLERSQQSTACRDLSEIRRSGVLRLVTRNSPTTCTIERGGIKGFEYDLAFRLARRLGVRLELAMPPPRTDPLEWLEQGYGDIAALHEPVTPDNENRFLVTTPCRRVNLVSVTRSDRDLPAAIEDLSGIDVAASRQVSALCRLLPLSPPIAASEPFSGADGLTALTMVVRGESDFAVVDSDLADLELAGRPELQLGPQVLPQVPLVWLLNHSSPRLHDTVNGYLRWARSTGLMRQLVLRHLGSWRPKVRPELPQVPPGNLTPYDEILKWVGRRRGIDWRLLASLMYEESRFNPFAVGPGGSSGLFQLMPATWRELGVDDPHHPMEAAEAGSLYLRHLMDMYEDLPMPDQVAMAIASYNVGPRHVFDARRHAGNLGLDPDRWLNNVESAMLDLDDPEIARQYSAGVCRCRRAVGYTGRILRRYRAYIEQFPPE
jgi:membrane-bound lytic murein transglycosylase F